MEIKREQYINQLEVRRKNGLVKVITGCRRSGKSYLLFKLFKQHLLDNGVETEDIIELALDRIENDYLREPHALYEFVSAKIKDPDHYYYVFLDEIQFVERFEEVLNSLMARENVDIYVTGSNSKLLSKDIITEFRGRGDEVKVHSLNFAEFMSAYQGEVRKGWQEYLTYGGLPRILQLPTDEQKAKYLKDLFEETYLKDIIERHHLRNPSELGELVNVLASAVGSLTNPSKLERTFKSIKGSDISDKTILTYIGYLEDAFLINGAMRYDVKGKRYIDTLVKYYFEDVGLRNARLDFRQSESNHLMENVIYNELVYRGYSVDVGIVEVTTAEPNGARKRVNLEIDFIATRGSEKYYIQSAFSMPDSEKIRQEERPLNSVKDSFKKIIVTGDNVATSRNDKGIVTFNIIDFLLDSESLRY